MGGMAIGINDDGKSQSAPVTREVLEHYSRESLTVGDLQMVMVLMPDGQYRGHFLEMPTKGMLEAMEYMVAALRRTVQ
jgi:hypothetical protein